MNFKLVSDFVPTGDQPRAISRLSQGLEQNLRHQTLLGATGTGKTFTMASIIAKANKPTLVLAHNKTLAAQLCSEFQGFFPENAVNYFVSYYDYYQPEAYMAKTDTFIEKEATINEEIAKFRHAATINLLTRRDTIIVSSVSCIYGIGDIEEYQGACIEFRVGKNYPRVEMLKSLVDIQYERIKTTFERGTFEVLGDIITIFPPDGDHAFQLEFWGDSLDKIKKIDGFTSAEIQNEEKITIFPAKHNITSKPKITEAIPLIKADLAIREKELRDVKKPLEAHRIHQRTMYDIEMLQSVGHIPGIENYARYFTGNAPGSPPTTLIDFFPSDFVCFVDESHISIPQIGGMYGGNLSRKKVLIDYGFRLPSAMDNRPLTFSEFESKIKTAVYVSATPGKYEYEKCPPGLIVEQIIRPTGLIDPSLEVRESEHQIDDILAEIHVTLKSKERVLITTVTKKDAENLAEYLIEQGIKAKYLHSDISTLERVEILTELRRGEIEVVVGINLLREGLDLPEVSFIGILDADKQGFLRSRDSLLQIIGRASRNSAGRVIMYSRGKKQTPAMKEAIAETTRRRNIQKAYNKKYGITPRTIIKEITDIAGSLGKKVKRDFSKLTKRDQIGEKIVELEFEMDKATAEWNFELAAELRDQIVELEEKLRKV